MTLARIAIVILWLLIAACRTAYPATLIEAIRQVESGGNDAATGDGGAM